MSPRKLSEPSYTSKKKPTLTHSLNDLSRSQESFSNPQKLKNKHIDDIKTNSNRSKSVGDVSSTFSTFHEHQGDPQNGGRKFLLIKIISNKFKSIKSKKFDIGEDDDDQFIIDSPSPLNQSNKKNESLLPFIKTKSEPLQQSELHHSPQLREKNPNKGSHIKLHRKSETKVGDLLAAINVKNGGDQDELLKHFVGADIINNLSNINTDFSSDSNDMLVGNNMFSF